MTDQPTTEARHPYDRRALTDDQRYLAEDIASGMPDRHDEDCGVWSEAGDGCTCPLVMAVADGLDASRVVAIEVERGYDPTTRRGERVVRLPFRPMPAAALPAQEPLDVERLAEAMTQAVPYYRLNPKGGGHRPPFSALTEVEREMVLADARALAAEYARLRDKEGRP